MDGRTRPDDRQTPADEPPHARRPTGESLEQVLRILRRNRALLEGTATASRKGEEQAGGGHTESSDPSGGVTRGDFSND